MAQKKTGRGRTVSKMLLNDDCSRRFEKNQLADNAPKYDSYCSVDDPDTTKVVGHLV